MEITFFEIDNASSHNFNISMSVNIQMVGIVKHSVCLKFISTIQNFHTHPLPAPNPPPEEANMSLLKTLA